MADESNFNAVWSVIMIIFLMLSVSHFILASITLNVKGIQSIRLGSEPLDKEFIDYTIKQNQISRTTNLITAIGYLVASITAFLSSKPRLLKKFLNKLSKKQKKVLLVIIVLFMLAFLIWVIIFVKETNKKDYPLSISFNSSGINWQFIGQKNVCFILPDGKKGIIKNLNEFEGDQEVGNCLEDYSKCKLSIKRYIPIFRNCESTCVAYNNKSYWDCDNLFPLSINFDSSVLFFDSSYSINLCLILPDGKKGIIKNLSEAKNNSIGYCLKDYTKCNLTIESYISFDNCDVTFRSNKDSPYWIRM